MRTGSKFLDSSDYSHIVYLFDLRRRVDHHPRGYAAVYVPIYHAEPELMPPSCHA